MSAVFGIYYRDGRPVDGELALMSRAIAYRGEVENQWSDRNVSLGIREGAEKLGKLHVTNDLVIVGELRLDDRTALSRLLDASPHCTDSELVLAAYRKWGEASPYQIIGDYAYAIWDRNRNRLFCARDSLGVRTFYYHLSARLFAFASEAKSLLGLESVSRDINEVRIGDWLVDLRQDKESTLFRDIARMPAATSFAVSSNEFQRRTFWSVEDVPTGPRMSDSDYVDGYIDRFRSAVESRLKGKVGAALSGGLDSSSIVCVATGLLGSTHETPLITYSAIFNEPKESDESEFVKAVCAEQPIENHFYYPAGSSLLDDPTESLGFDEPVWVPQTVVQVHGLRIAKSLGLGAVLEGHGGDEVTSYGTARFVELFRQRRFLELWRESQGPNKQFAARRAAKVFVRYGARPVLSQWIPANLKRLLKGAPGTWYSDIPLRPGFRDRCRLDERWNHFKRPFATPARTAREWDMRVLNSGEMSHTIEITTRLSEAFGIEQRLPFLDRRFVEFCLNIPSHLKHRDGWPRWIARKALTGVLPDPVAWRPGKLIGTSVVVDQLAGSDLARMRHALLEDFSPLLPFLEPGGVEATIQRFGRDRHWPDGYFLWRAATISRFLRAANSY